MVSLLRRIVGHVHTYDMIEPLYNPSGSGSSGWSGCRRRLCAEDGRAKGDEGSLSGPGVSPSPIAVASSFVSSQTSGCSVERPYSLRTVSHHNGVKASVLQILRHFGRQASPLTLFLVGLKWILPASLTLRRCPRRGTSRASSLFLS